MNISGGGSGSAAPTGWPLSWFAMVGLGSLAPFNVAFTANQTGIQGFVLPASLTFNKIIVDVNTVDAVGNYDIGIYNYAGQLLANIGAQHLPSTGLQSFTVLQAPVTLPPGRYLFGTTGTATTALLEANNPTRSGLTFLQKTAVGASAGGALPAAVTPGADSVNGTLLPIFALSI